MVRFSEERDGRDDDVDFMDPFFQNAPISRAILDLLRKLTDKFQDMPPETTDMDWTAFKALSSAGAAEGITRLTCTYADAEGPSTEYFHVRGHGMAGMPARQFLTTEPHELVLAKARLTTTGVQWAQYLAEEGAQPEKIRGLVLTLLWKAERQPGSAHRVPPPSPSDATAPVAAHADGGSTVSNLHVVTPAPASPIAPATAAPAVAPATADRETAGGPNHPPKPTVEDEKGAGSTDDETVEVEFGAPQVDLHDRRVVNWVGKRLYLGHDTQVSRLFWLLAKKPGVPHDLGQVQRAVDGFETSRDDADEKTYQKALNRVRKAVSKLRDHLREHELDTHVIIHRDGPNNWPTYTMILRFGKH